MVAAVGRSCGHLLAQPLQLGGCCCRGVRSAPTIASSYRPRCITRPWGRNEPVGNGRPRTTWLRCLCCPPPPPLALDVATRPFRSPIQGRSRVGGAGCSSAGGQAVRAPALPRGPHLEPQTAPGWHPPWACGMLRASWGPVVRLHCKRAEVPCRRLCKPGRPGPQTWPTDLSTVVPAPTSPLPQMLQRPGLARHHESGKKVFKPTPVLAIQPPMPQPPHPSPPPSSS